MMPQETDQLMEARVDRGYVALLILLALIFVAFLFRLNKVLIADMDEGTYLYAGKLVAEGLSPYRDFLFAHPPFVILFALAAHRAFGGDLMGARLAYLTLTLLSTIPLYAITRNLARSALAGLFAVAMYTTGMLLLANMGRTVRLEPLMNAFLIAAFAAHLLLPRSAGARLAVGALIALAGLTKLVAIIPVSILVLGELLTERSWRALRAWLISVAGACAVAIPAALLLLRYPRFVENVLTSHLHRPGLPLSVRLHFVWQDFTRDPLVPLAFAAAVYLLAAGRDRRARLIALVALGSSAILVFAFKTFFGYYLVQTLPWLSIALAVAAAQTAARWPAFARGRAVAVGALLFIGVCIPLAYEEYYYRRADDHVSSPARIVSLLRGETGNMYSMYPSFALLSGRELYPWYYTADSLIPRLLAQIGDADFIRVFAGCQSLVLYEKELAPYPAALAYVRQHFSVAYADAYYTLWMRSSPEKTPR